ncbi:hypothetical protein ACR42D_10090 [Desulfovibrio caledoniensis]
MLKRRLAKALERMPRLFERWTEYRVGVKGRGIMWRQRMHCLEDFKTSDRGFELAAQTLSVPMEELKFIMIPLFPRFTPWENLKKRWA